MTMNPYLFVYGTLLKEYKEPRPIEILAFAKYVGKAWMYGQLYKVSYYPGLIIPEKKENCQQVRGEVYELYNPAQAIELLDDYEDYFENDLDESLYLRKEVDCYVGETDSKTKAWTYIYNQTHEADQLIKSGDFMHP